MAALIPSPRGESGGELREAKLKKLPPAEQASQVARARQADKELNLRGLIRLGSKQPASISPYEAGASELIVSLCANFADKTDPNTERWSQLADKAGLPPSSHSCSHPTGLLQCGSTQSSRCEKSRMCGRLSPPRCFAHCC